MLVRDFITNSISIFYFYHGEANDINLTELSILDYIDVSGEVKVKMTDPCIHTANGGIEDSTNEELAKVQSFDNHELQVYN